MSKAGETFERSIKDAERLLEIFNKLHPGGGHPPPEAEVLKRAGLIMAMTAWETYVEDRLDEALEARLVALNDPTIAQLIRKKLSDEIGRLHNPTSERTLPERCRWLASRAGKSPAALTWLSLVVSLCIRARASPQRLCSNRAHS